MLPFRATWGYPSYVPTNKSSCPASCRFSLQGPATTKMAVPGPALGKAALILLKAPGVAPVQSTTSWGPRHSGQQKGQRKQKQKKTGQKNKRRLSEHCTSPLVERVWIEPLNCRQPGRGRPRQASDVERLARNVVSCRGLSYKRSAANGRSLLLGEIRDRMRRRGMQRSL